MGKKFVVTIDSSHISLSCKRGSFTFSNGSIIEDQEIANNFPSFFKELIEEEPPAELVSETYENEPDPIIDEPIILEPASLIPIDATPVEAIVEAPVVDVPPAELVSETYENEPDPIIDEPITLEPASLIPIDATPVEAIVEAPVVDVPAEATDATVAEPIVEDDTTEDEDDAIDGDAPVDGSAPAKKRLGRKPKVQ